MDLQKTFDLPKILRLGKQMLELSYSPYSSFKVGAVAVSDTDELFRGCNVENASYSITICAEVAAIVNMVSSGHRNLKALFVFSNSEQFLPPCGACRQCILEFCVSGDTPILMVNSKGDIRYHPVSVLIPHAFSNEDLPEESSL